MAPDRGTLLADIRRRALVAPEALVQGAVRLSPDAAKHLAVVRLQPGDRIELLDGQGRHAHATLTSPNTADADAPQAAPPTDPAVAVTLVFAVPKGDAADGIIRSCTELGVSTVAPVTTERTISHPKPKRVERWRRIAESATLQSGRYRVPEILPLCPVAAALEGLPDTVTLRLAPWVPEESAPFPASPSHGEHPGAALLIGPEGGLTDAEAELARTHGFDTVTLGPRVLRVATAAISAITLLLRPS
jgi:16S rRNA (uracil1498-N3)-methyltransferase